MGRRSSSSSLWTDPSHLEHLERDLVFEGSPREIGNQAEAIVATGIVRIRELTLRGGEPHGQRTGAEFLAARVPTAAEFGNFKSEFECLSTRLMNQEAQIGRMKMTAAAETNRFQRPARAIMNDDERMAVIDHLARNPTAGVSTGAGEWILQFAREGGGKSGGFPIICFYRMDESIPICC